MLESLFSKDQLVIIYRFSLEIEFDMGFNDDGDGYNMDLDDHHLPPNPDQPNNDAEGNPQSVWPYQLL